MADPVTAEVAGLQLSNNTFSASPPGSMLRADNCVIPSKGVVQPRNGQPLYWLCSAAGELPFAVTEFEGSQIISAAPSKLSTAYTLALAGSPTTAYAGGPYNPVDCDGVSTSYGRMKFGFAGGNMYFCRAWEPMALGAPAGPPRGAGLGRMPDVVAVMESASSVTASIGGAWLPYGSSVAYRSVLRYPLSDGTSLLSAPSGRFVVTNRIRAMPGEMVRTGGNLVTVTLPGSTVTGLAVGDAFTLDPGEANFAAGPYTVASTPSQNSFTYADVGANVANTLVTGQDFDTGPRPTLVAAQLNAQATTSTPVRFYKSRATTSDSPSDELFLVDERFPTSAQITAGVVGFMDATPESVINDPLYTNPLTGDGASQANFQPPIYRDLANWGERAWYANTTSKHQLRMQMLGVGSPDGIQNGDTLTVEIDGDTIQVEFVNTTTAGLQVVIEDDGLPSFNIEKTMQRMIIAFNSYAKALPSPIRMYSLVAEDDSPGVFQLERTDYEPTAFEVTASRPESWTPALDAVTAVESTAERIPNGLSYSKLGQPEAVPLVNYLAVGAKNYAIARILGLKQALLVFKEGDGIYAVTGSSPFLVEQISTANIVAPDCAAVFADAAWVYTDQGILRVSDGGGATVVSRPIETVLNELRAEFPDETYDYAFAVPYETERRIYFYVPFESGYPTPSLKAWCYNNATQTWTGPLGPEALSGIVSPTQDKLMLGSGPVADEVSRGYISRERKTQTYQDIADLDYVVDITATDVGGNPLLLSLEVDGISGPLVGLGGISPGDVLTQGSYATKIKALRPDIDVQTVEVYEEAPWTVATASLYRGYEVVAQFQPSGNPVARKTLSRLAWLFKPEQFATYGGKTLLFTDQIQADLEVATPSVGFGLHPFGVGPFGNPSPMVVDVNPLDPLRTNAAQFFPGFKTSEAWVKLRLQGFGAQLETAQSPVGRGK